MSSSSSTDSRVLLVEDDTSLCNLIAHELGQIGLAVTSTDSSVDAIIKVQQEPYAVLLLDIMLNGTSGLYVIDALRDLPSDDRPRVVVITGARGSILSNIDRTIVRAVFFKPLDMTSLGAYVKSIAR
ncbi:MAG TPA: response regulator [Thermoanaerobaculia bacterium]